MIINTKLGFVFVAVPRTASRSMHAALMRLSGSSSHGRHHSTDIPTFASAFDVVGCIRNPYWRVWSHFKHRKDRVPAGNCSKFVGGMDFESYLRWLASPNGSRAEELERTCPDPVDDPPVTVLLARCNVRHVVRFEELPESFLRLSFLPDGLELPSINNSTHVVSAPYDQRLANLVWSRYRADFQAFGYHRSSWRKPDA